MQPQQPDSSYSQPVQQPAPTPAPTAVAQHPCWYINGPTIFQAKKSVVIVDLGWVVVYDAQTNQEFVRFPLTANTKLRASFGMARVTSLDGQRIGAFNKKYSLFFYNPKLSLLSYWLALLGTSKAKAFVTACQSAAVGYPNS